MVRSALGALARRFGGPASALEVVVPAAEVIALTAKVTIVPAPEIVAAATLELAGCSGGERRNQAPQRRLPAVRAWGVG